ncbi:hypothetical protein [Streptosporangium sp. OZ121]|uniref:hypothetical protein n=1 Tax=Streptosporangium sp. OZ121 TaxID=3444183 RepID=UPI003F7A82EF
MDLLIVLLGDALVGHRGAGPISSVIAANWTRASATMASCSDSSSHRADIPELIINADPDSWYHGAPQSMGQENHDEFREATKNPNVVPRDQQRRR